MKAEGARFSIVCAGIAIGISLGCAGSGDSSSSDSPSGDEGLAGPGACRLLVDTLADKAVECASRVGVAVASRDALRASFEGAFPGGCAAVSRVRDPSAFQSVCLPAIKSVDCTQMAGGVNAASISSACANPFVFGGEDASIPAPRDAGAVGVCTPESDSAFCARLGKTCGRVMGTDNCGSPRLLASCGTCASPATCGGGGVPNVCTANCVPEPPGEFCRRLGKECGQASGNDNCGAWRSSVSCGSCSAPNVCSATNTCVCQAETDAALCQRLGKNCGAASGYDTCNRWRSSVSCGTCTSPETCGGGGVTNVCGQAVCRPESDYTFCYRYGKTCDSYTAADNCGASRTASCGTCSSPQTCSGGGTPNVCGCTAESDAAYCARNNANCGSALGNDNCGHWRSVNSCGSCSAPETCGGGGTSRQCGCTGESDAAFCSRLGATCGTLTASDNCGRARTVASCGSCPTNKTCGESNTCQDVTCPTGQRSCGGACQPCPTANVKTTQCYGSACHAETCDDGYGLNVGYCIAKPCSTGSLYCSYHCDPCPTTGALTFGCGNNRCVATTCAAGYLLSGGRCIDPDWSTETIDSNVSRPFYWSSRGYAVIALDPLDALYVAYATSQGGVVARRSASGWAKTTFSAPSIDRVANLVVDGSGNAHVIYRYYYGQDWAGNLIYKYKYVRVSPTGGTSLKLDLNAFIAWDSALAVDGTGDAHLVESDGSLSYRRTYGGAWLAPIGVTTTPWSARAIAVDAQGAVHLAGVNGNQLLYTKGVGGIFSTPLSVTAPTSFSKAQLYVGGATPEIWAQGNGGWFVSTVSATAVSTPTAWFTQTTIPTTISGARGPTGFAMLEESGYTHKARRGPVTGPTLTEEPNLDFSTLERAAVIDRNGTFHTLAWDTYYSGGDILYYVRGH